MVFFVLMELSSHCPLLIHLINLKTFMSTLTIGHNVSLESYFCLASSTKKIQEAKWANLNEKHQTPLCIILIVIIYLHPGQVFVINIILDSLCLLNTNGFIINALHKNMLTFTCTHLSPYKIQKGSKSSPQKYIILIASYKIHFKVIFFFVIALDIL